MILHAMASTKKIERLQYSIFSLKQLHSNEIFLSENVLLKVASMELATVTLQLKVFMFIGGATISVKN